MARTPAKSTTSRRPARRRTQRPDTPPPATADAGPEATDSPPAPEKPSRSRKPAPLAVPAEAEAAEKKTGPVVSVEETSTTLRKVLLNLAFLFAFLLLVPVVIQQFLRNEVVIEPISVPESLAEIGLTPDVVSRRLWDGLQDAIRRAGTAKASVLAVPNSDRIQFSIPETGLSIEALVTQTRQFFRTYQTRISGEIVCAGADCSAQGMQLRLRIQRGTTEVIELPVRGDMAERAYFTEAAIRILTVLDPFVAIAAIGDSSPVRATKLARDLIRTRHPDAHWAHNLIGNLRTDGGEPQLAEPEYRAALALKPDFTIAKVNLALTLMNIAAAAPAAPVAPDLGEAEALLDSARTETPQSATLHAAEGYLAALREDYATAIARYQQAAVLDPTDPSLLARAGELELKHGDAQRGITMLTAALDADPTGLVALTALTMHYIAAGEPQRATEILGNAVAISPDDPSFNYLLGLSLMSQSRYREAETALTRALAGSPDDHEYLFQQAMLLTRTNRPEDAIAILERIVVEDPTDAAALAALAEAEFGLGRIEPATGHYEQALALNPDDPNVLYGLGFARALAGHYDEAIATTERAIALAPDRYDLFFALGNYYTFVDRPDAAITAYQRFLELLPEAAPAMSARRIAEDYIASHAEAAP